MTMGCLEFGGDSHTRKADWFGMTMLFDTRSFLAKFQFVVLLRFFDMLFEKIPV